MNSFGKWTGEQRQYSESLCQKCRRRGLLGRPTKCMYCGQTEGPIQVHTTDYDVEMEVAQKMLDGTATPDDIKRFKAVRQPVCRRCHMAIHSSNEGYRRWYFSQVQSGRTFPPMYYGNENKQNEKDKNQPSLFD